MRISFDYQIFCQQMYGGISRYFVRLSEKLIALKQEVGIFAPLHQNQYLKELPPSMVHGNFIKHYPPKSSRIILPINHLLSKQSIKKWNPNIVHETYFSLWSSAPKSCPTVITVYDMIDELITFQSSTKNKSTILKKLAIERADHVICISENTRQDLMNLFGTREEKLSVVHLGFERFIDNNIPPSFILPQVKPYLLYVGNRGGYKNFSGFVRAVASSQRLKTDFDIIAFGGGRFTNAEVAFFSKLNYGENQIRHLGGDDALLGQLYERSAAFIFPSIYEGFGLPPLEAMAHNCPVISSNTSSMPEIIGEAGEFFDPKAIDDITLAIERVVYSQKRTKYLIELGQKRLDNFSWNLCASQTLKIYHDLQN